MLNKLLICLIFCAILFGCGGSDKSLKYKVGDVVYLKPDSTVGAIVEVEAAGDDYKITLGYNEGFFANNIVYVNEEVIYGKRQ